MQTITKFLHLVGPTSLVLADAEYEVDRVCKNIVKSFTSDEVATVEAFLAELCEEDLRVMFEGEGHEVSALYRRMNVAVSKQELIEELLNFALTDF